MTSAATALPAAPAVPAFPLKRIVRSGIALLLAMVLLELCAQAVKTYIIPRKWAKLDNSRMAPQPLSDIDYADTVEGRGARLGKLSVNSLGFRGPEPTLGNERKPGRLRVYCLGSSTTFGWGASTDGKAYPAQLEAELTTLLPGTRIEVINAGVPGNNSENELQILKEDLPRLNPDIVIIWSGWPDWGHYMSQPAKKSKKNKLLANLANTYQKTGSCRVAEYIRDLVTPRPSPPSDEELDQRKGLKTFRVDVINKFTATLTQELKLCQDSGVSPVVLGLATPLRAEPQNLSPLARKQAANRLHAFPAASRADLYRGILDFDKCLLQTASATASSRYITPEDLPSDPALFIDGVHMNDAGYAALARAIAPTIRDVVYCKDAWVPCE